MVSMCTQKTGGRGEEFVLIYFSFYIIIQVVREHNTEVPLERKFEHEKCRCHTVEAFSHMAKGKSRPIFWVWRSNPNPCRKRKGSEKVFCFLGGK